MKAMILAAGLGTRLKPFTDRHPKALAVVNGKTILQRNIEYLSSFGIREIIINVHHFADQIVAVLNKNKGFGCDISISDERDEVLETGGGLKKAGFFFTGDSDPFVLMNVDVLSDLDIGKMVGQHISYKALATLAVSDRTTSRYFLFDGHNKLCGWKNEKTGEQKIIRTAEKIIQKAFSGIHVISPEIFSLVDLTGKFSMVDLYLQLGNTQSIYAFDHSGAVFIDVGTPQSLIKAEELFR